MVHVIELRDVYNMIVYNKGGTADFRPLHFAEGVFMWIYNKCWGSLEFLIKMFYGACCSILFSHRRAYFMHFTIYGVY